MDIKRLFLMVYWRKEAQTSAPITILGFFIFTYHKKPVISSHSVTPRVPIFSAYHF